MRQSSHTKRVGLPHVFRLTGLNPEPFIQNIHQPGTRHVVEEFLPKYIDLGGTRHKNQFPQRFRRMFSKEKVNWWERVTNEHFP